MTLEKPISFRPIGVIHTPFKKVEDMPIQPQGGSGVRGTLMLDPEFTEGLTDLDGFSHIYILFHLHEARPFRLTVTPFLDTNPHGLFATRAPSRPNAIGLSIVRLVEVKENVLTIENVDMLDGTPLLDIKPYVPFFDDQVNVRIGWLARFRDQANSIRTDDRFK
jgi:tRNA-Thr(GGU) m(6)t(6)A37 methyltransferase TsaA